MIPFELERIGIIMKPQPENPNEVEGVLNPAAARGNDGHLYLFPRLVAQNNFSRIGIARVNFDHNGEPVGVERLGIALQPEAPYELHPSGGGCEDPRITYVEPIERFVMTYTAFGPKGPRIAMACSKDLFNWERMGLVSFKPYEERHVNFNDVDNKDASFFPVALPSPHHHRSIAMLHRPLFPGTNPNETVKKDGVSRKIDTDKESIFISYFNLTKGKETNLRNADFTSHHRLAQPTFPWENLKVGGGAPPILTKYGWLMIYHGVQKQEESKEEEPRLCYAAGVMILSEKEPQKIIYRSAKPILRPQTPEEKIGTVDDVVFPTGLDRRTDINQPNRIDVYYGMADHKIGVAKMFIPEILPITERSDEY